MPNKSKNRNNGNLNEVTSLKRTLDKTEKSHEDNYFSCDDYVER